MEMSNAQQVKLGAAIHETLVQLQTSDLSLRLCITPVRCNGSMYGIEVMLKSSSKRRQIFNA